MMMLQSLFRSLFFVFLTISPIVSYTNPLTIDFFKNWICIGIKEDIDFKKPYATNIGELPLVLWKNIRTNKIHSSLNICKHMGSTFNKGKITEGGCLKCPYHGLEYSSADQFGEIMEQDGKIFWSYKPTLSRPYQIPFFNNPNYEKSFLTIDMEASLTDSAFNTMDLRHPEYVHGGVGFGNDIPPENIKEYQFSKKMLGLSFDYIANHWIRKINKNANSTQNFHMFYYPAFSWSKVTFDKTKHLIIGVNLLPLENKKTRWFVTICHNYYKSALQKQFMKMLALVILTQDFVQMKNQFKETKLKQELLFNHVFNNELTIMRLKNMLSEYRYPDENICLQLYKDYKNSLII
jgi:nitrite reductase/ring-hydroxylating ferredoxin subunit